MFGGLMVQNIKSVQILAKDNKSKCKILLIKGVNEEKNPNMALYEKVILDVFGVFFINALFGLS